MSRLIVLFVVLFLPLQFAWSAASAYCEHEGQRTGQTDISATASQHIGHHFHAHQAEAGKSAAGQAGADSDCASCHAAGGVVIAPTLTARSFLRSAAAPATVTLPAFTSALARAPDRPQWLRLV